MQAVSLNALNLAVEGVPGPQSKVTPAVPPTEPASPPQAPNTSPKTQAPDQPLEPLLTVRRDQTGRLYYVISDAQSGQEIAQLPPEELRNVGEAIAAFLQKQEEHNASNAHIETEA